MPSTATITAFYNFAANTKARATQVNANFDTFRGHIIPVEVLTATSANMLYDLGSTDYRWRTAYLRSLDFASNTTTGSAVQILAATSGSIPYISWMIAGTERARFSEAGVRSIPASSYLNVTISAGVGGIAGSVALSLAAYALSLTSVAISGSTLTLQTLGNPVNVFINPVANTSGADYLSINTIRSTTGTAGGYIELYRDATFLSRFDYFVGPFTGQSTIELPVSSVKCFDVVAAGTYTYHLKCFGVGGAAGVTSNSLTMRNCRLMAYEK